MKRITLLLVSLALSSCALTSPPTENADFAVLPSLEQLEGSYQNLGVGEKGIPPVHLSKLIWPNSGLNHASITSVNVALQGNDSLRIRAEADGSVLKESVFREGKDFELTSGRLVIKQGCEIMGHRRGDVILGAGCGTVELGLDSRGDGKYSRETTVAGFLFALFPFAATSSEHVRFIRHSE